VDALAQLEKDGVKVFPTPDLLRIVQDKGLQKQFYQDNNIPTAPFRLIENKAEIANHTDGFPYMQKLRKGGYDGKGVFKLTDPNNLEGAFDAPCVLEELVDFETEIAIIVARNEHGEINTFPLVDMVFNAQANLVEFLFAPADLGQDVADKAKAIAHQLAESLGLVGILAVELFLTKNGDVLVNEIAPRPHNSGHHTIEANFTSQYAQHLRAITGLPLGNTATRSAACMVNILGEAGHDGEAVYQGLDKVTAIQGAYVHLYGKKFTRPFRKMGHATVVASTIEEAKEKARQVGDTLKVITTQTPQEA